MATELFSIWGGLTGWRSQHGTGFQITAILDGVEIWYVGDKVCDVKRAFYRACRRTVLRRIFPFLAAPPAELTLREQR
jgi:hypothetical protein